MIFIFKAITAILYTIMTFILDIFMWGTVVMIAGWCWNNILAKMLHMPKASFTVVLLYMGVYFALKALIRLVTMKIKITEEEP